MRIGINALAINPKYRGGINSYTFGLLRAFKELNTNHQFVVFAASHNVEIFDEFRGANFSILCLENYQNPLKKVFKRFAQYSRSESVYKGVCDIAYGHISRKIQAAADIVYTPTTTLLPFNLKVKTVVSMHDIQQVHYPHFFSGHELLYRRLTFNLTAKHADYIQASSQFIKRDLLEHFSQLKSEQIVVIPEGVDVPTFSGKTEVIRSNSTDEGSIDSNRTYDSSSTAGSNGSNPIGDSSSVDRGPVDLSSAALNSISQGLRQKDFIFFPAQLWPHKNHMTVLKALHKIHTEQGITIPMVMTGEAYGANQNIQNFITENKMSYVKYLGKVPFATLITLYQQAWAVITAVLYESSSLCMLEAAAAGSALIASRTPPNIEMSEILEMNLFDTLSVNDLALLLVKLRQNPKLLQDQVTKNSQRVAHYSWANAAKRYLELFEKIYAT